MTKEEITESKDNSEFTCLLGLSLYEITKITTHNRRNIGHPVKQGYMFSFFIDGRERANYFNESIEKVKEIRQKYIKLFEDMEKPKPNELYEKRKDTLNKLISSTKDLLASYEMELEELEEK